MQCRNLLRSAGQRTNCIPNGPKTVYCPCRTGQKQSNVHAELAENTSNVHAELAQNTSNVHAELAENTFSVHSERAENSPMSTLNRPKTRLMSMPTGQKLSNVYAAERAKNASNGPKTVPGKFNRPSVYTHAATHWFPSLAWFTVPCSWNTCACANTHTHTHTLALAQRRQLLDLFHVLHDRLAFKAGGS